MFKQQVLDVWLEVGVRKFDFDRVLSRLYEVIRFHKLPRTEMSVRTHALVHVYLSEKNLHRDKKEWEREQKRDRKE